MDLRFKDGEELSCKVLVRGKTFLFVRDNKTGEYKILNTERLPDNENSKLQQQTCADSVGDGGGADEAEE